MSARLAKIPHKRASDTRYIPTVQPGMAPFRQPMVTTACGQEIVATLVTSRDDRVRCPECKAATDEPAAARAVRQHFYREHQETEPRSVSWPGYSAADLDRFHAEAHQHGAEPPHDYESPESLAATPHSWLRVIVWHGNDTGDEDEASAIATVHNLTTNAEAARREQ